jgi:TolB-like protein
MLLRAAPGGAAPADGGLERARDAVVVLELRPIGVADTDARMITAQLAELLGQRAELRVITADELNELVQHQTTLRTMSCESEQCIAEMTKVANARLALSGSVGKVGDAMVVSLTLVDVERASSVGSASLSVKSLEEVLSVLPEVLAETFQWPGAGEAEKARFTLPEGAKLSLAVFDLKPLGISPDAAQNLTQVLASEIKQVRGASVVSRDDIASMLEMEAQKDRLTCTSETNCLAEIGGALGVDKLVVGHAGKLGDSYVISLRLINVRQVRVDNRVTESFKGLEDQLLRAVRLAGRSLLGIDAKEPGTLALAGSQVEAAVFLDEKDAGQLPMPAVGGLVPGRHSLRVAKKGFLDWRSDVYVEANGTTAVWAELQEAPAKWYQKWWVWGGVGALVVGGGAAAYALTQPSKGTLSVTSGVPGGAP